MFGFFFEGDVQYAIAPAQTHPLQHVAGSDLSRLARFAVRALGTHTAILREGVIPTVAALFLSNTSVRGRMS